MSLIGFLGTLIKTGVQDQITAVKAQAVILMENKGMVDALKAGNYMASQDYPKHAAYFYDKANESRRKIVAAREAWWQTGATIGLMTPGLEELPETDFLLPEKG